MYIKSERFHCFSGTCLLNAQVTALFPGHSRAWGSDVRPESFETAGRLFQKPPQDWTTICSTRLLGISCKQKSFCSHLHGLTHERDPVVRSNSNYSMLSFKWKFQLSPLYPLSGYWKPEVSSWRIWSWMQFYDKTATESSWLGRSTWQVLLWTALSLFQHRLSLPKSQNPEYSHYRIKSLLTSMLPYLKELYKPLCFDYDCSQLWTRCQLWTG